MSLFSIFLLTSFYNLINTSTIHKCTSTSPCIDTKILCAPNKPCNIICDTCINTHIICPSNTTNCIINCINNNSCNNITIIPNSNKNILNCYENSCNLINFKCKNDDICIKNDLKYIKNNNFNQFRRKLAWNDLKITVSEDSLILIGVGLGSVLLILVLAILCICCLCNVYRATEVDLRNKMQTTAMNNGATMSHVVQLSDPSAQTIGTSSNKDSSNVQIIYDNSNNNKSQLNPQQMNRQVSTSSNFSQFSQKLEVQNLIGKLKKRQEDREREYRQRRSKSNEMRAKFKQRKSMEQAKSLNNIDTPPSSISTQNITQNNNDKIIKQRFMVDNIMNKNNNINNINNKLIDNNINNNNKNGVITSPIKAAKKKSSSNHSKKKSKKKSKKEKSRKKSKNNKSFSAKKRSITKSPKKKDKQRRKSSKQRKTDNDFIFIDQIYAEYCQKYKTIPRTVEPIIRYCDVNNIQIDKNKLKYYYLQRKKFEKKFLNGINNNNNNNQSIGSINSFASPKSRTKEFSLHMAPKSRSKITVKLPPTTDVEESEFSQNTNSEFTINDAMSVQIRQTPKNHLSFGVPINNIISNMNNNKLSVNHMPMTNLLEKMGWSYHSDTESYMESKRKKKMDPNYESSSSSNIADYFTESDSDSDTNDNDNNKNNNTNDNNEDTNDSDTFRSDTNESSSSASETEEDNDEIKENIFKKPNINTNNINSIQNITKNNDNNNNNNVLKNIGSGDEDEKVLNEILRKEMISL